MDPARRALGALLRATDGDRQFPIKSEYFATNPDDAEVLQQLLADHRFVVEIVAGAWGSPRLAVTLPGVFALDAGEWGREQAAIIELCDTLREFSRTRSREQVNTSHFKPAQRRWPCLEEPVLRRITQIVSTRLSGQYPDDPTGYQGWGASIGGADRSGFFAWINLSPMFLQDYRPQRITGPLLSPSQTAKRPMARLDPLRLSSNAGPRAVLALATTPGVPIHAVDLQAAAADLLPLPVPAVDLSKWPTHSRLEGMHRRRLDPLARRLVLLRELAGRGKVPPRWAADPLRRAAELEAELEGLVASDHIPGDFGPIKDASRVIKRAIGGLTATPEWAWLTPHLELGEWSRWLD